MSIYIDNATGGTLYLFGDPKDFIDPPSQIESGETGELRYHPGTPATCDYGDKKGNAIWIGVGSEDGNRVRNLVNFRRFNGSLS
ncbi:hypothetical protein GGI35DRAFT_86708 [Trichoderma velutinum]